MTIRDLRGDRMADPLARAIRSARFEPTDTSPEVRWGAVFYGTDGARIAGVYFDVTGKQGFLGDTPASIRGELFSWLKTSFPPNF